MESFVVRDNHYNRDDRNSLQACKILVFSQERESDIWKQRQEDLWDSYPKDNKKKELKINASKAFNILSGIVFFIVVIL